MNIPRLILALALLLPSIGCAAGPYRHYRYDGERVIIVRPHREHHSERRGHEQGERHEHREGHRR